MDSGGSGSRPIKSPVPLHNIGKIPGGVKGLPDIRGFFENGLYRQTSANSRTAKVIPFLGNTWSFPLSPDERPKPEFQGGREFILQDFIGRKLQLLEETSRTFVGLSLRFGITCLRD